jgi:hypothetical protein
MSDDLVLPIKMDNGLGKAKLLKGPLLRFWQLRSNLLNLNLVLLGWPPIIA